MSKDQRETLQKMNDLKTEKLLPDIESMRIELKKKSR
jgi:hypothetical protein